MNKVFQSYLRQFILVFFDDILIYSRTWEEHLECIKLVFSLLRLQHLFLMQSKCSFAITQVAYLGHIISKARVSVDENKVFAIIDWLVPQSILGKRA